MATKDIVCKDCGKLLARIIKVKNAGKYESTSLCYACAEKRWEAQKCSIKAAQ